MQFKDVIGLDLSKQKLLDQFQQNRISHAQMFIGKEGSGHFQLALAYAQYVNCFNPIENDSCGKCSSCVKFNNFQHPDLHFVFPNNTNGEVKKDPRSSLFLGTWVNFLKNNPYFTLNDWAEELGVGNKQVMINKLDIKDINHTLSLQKQSANYKVVLLWWPEKMNITAANKLLKVLEEPSEHTLFLLVGHQVEELIPTIISRVQTMVIEPLKVDEIKAALIQQESLPETAADTISNLCMGDFSKALKMAVNPDVGSLFTDNYITWMRACYELNMKVLLHWIDEVNRMGREKIKDFLEYCMRMFREVMMYNYAGPEHSGMSGVEQKFANKFSRFVHGGNIDFFYNSFNETHYAITRNGNPKIQLLSLSLNICNFLRYKP